MLRVRLAILGATAALALGAATAFAMTETGVSGDPDSHGDAVASAARNCPHGASGVHGACVSAIASANGQSHRDGAQAGRVKACKATDTAEDATESSTAKPGDRAAKSTDHAEDRNEHRAFAACVSGQTAAGSGS